MTFIEIMYLTTSIIAVANIIYVNFKNSKERSLLNSNIQDLYKMIITNTKNVNQEIEKLHNYRIENSTTIRDLPKIINQSMNNLKTEFVNMSKLLDDRINKFKLEVIKYEPAKAEAIENSPSTEFISEVNKKKTPIKPKQA